MQELPRREMRRGKTGVEDVSPRFGREASYSRGRGGFLLVFSRTWISLDLVASRIHKSTLLILRTPSYTPSPIRLRQNLRDEKKGIPMCRSVPLVLGASIGHWLLACIWARHLISSFLLAPRVRQQNLDETQEWTQRVTNRSHRGLHQSSTRDSIREWVANHDRARKYVLRRSSEHTRFGVGACAQKAFGTWASGLRDLQLAMAYGPRIHYAYDLLAMGPGLLAIGYWHGRHHLISRQLPGRVSSQRRREAHVLSRCVFRPRPD